MDQPGAHHHYDVRANHCQIEMVNYCANDESLNYIFLKIILFLL